MEQTPEIVYVIQPIERADYKVLHAEAVSLIESANAQYGGTIYQTIREINPATYIGEGKLEELRERLKDLDVTVLFNGQLSPSQTTNISAALNGKKVIDRTTLILDIFALRAKSSEGKLQVELAQLKYLYPRLKGRGATLSRLGGGIGTRGPGETQLETDRRHIRARIQSLEEKQKALENRRSLQTQKRKKNGVKTIALVGYTNTGKSTLFNAMTNSDVLEKDALFATLDPTARELKINSVPFLMIDTVGFLQDLPHTLIDAFHSTLESAVSCDLALIVCDSSSDYEMQFETTYKTLKDLHFASDYLVVMNQCDKNPNVRFKDAISVSAKYGTGLNTLKQKIYERFHNQFLEIQFRVPYAKSALYQKLRPFLTVKNVTYLEEEFAVDAVLPSIYQDKFKEFDFS